MTADQSLREVGHARERVCSSSDSSEEEEEEEEEGKDSGHSTRSRPPPPPRPPPQPPSSDQRRCFRFRSPQLLDLGVPDFLLRAPALGGVVVLACLVVNRWRRSWDEVQVGVGKEGGMAGAWGVVALEARCDALGGGWGRWVV